MSRACRIIVIIAAAAMTATTPAPVMANLPAVTEGSAEVDATVRQSVGNYVPDARIAGMGTLRMLGFHVYDARLFVGAHGLDSDLAADRPYALDLRYARNFKGAAIAKRTRKEMERLGLASADERMKWAMILSGLLPDVQAGDHLTGIYQPGRGTVFLHNGKPVGEVEGVAFARSFFAIWLHPDTSAPAVRAALLAGAGPTGQP